MPRDGRAAVGRAECRRSTARAPDPEVADARVAQLPGDVVVAPQEDGRPPRDVVAQLAEAPRSGCPAARCPALKREHGDDVAAVTTKDTPASSARSETRRRASALGLSSPPSRHHQQRRGDRQRLRGVVGEADRSATTRRTHARGRQPVGTRHPRRAAVEGAPDRRSRGTPAPRRARQPLAPGRGGSRRSARPRAPRRTRAARTGSRPTLPAALAGRRSTYRPGPRLKKTVSDLEDPRRSPDHGDDRRRRGADACATLGRIRWATIVARVTATPMPTNHSSAGTEKARGRRRRGAAIADDPPAPPGPVAQQPRAGRAVKVSDERGDHRLLEGRLDATKAALEVAQPHERRPERLHAWRARASSAASAVSAVSTGTAMITPTNADSIETPSSVAHGRHDRMGADGVGDVDALSPSCRRASGCRRTRGAARGRR